MSAEPIVYFNGEYLPANEARIPLFDLGLHGVAATEMTRTFGHRCYRLDDHLDRLNNSMSKLGLHADLLRDDWQRITQTVVEHNAALISGDADLLVNHLVTAGPHPSYGTAKPGAATERVTICVQAFPIPFARFADQYETGQHLVVPDVRHIPPECLEPGIKSRNRLHWYLADRAAREIDPAAAALLCDMDGQLTETSAGNFFIVEGDAIVTPPLRNILNGISRTVVRDIARYLDRRFLEQEISLDRALSAQEALTSSTTYCVLPVTRINQQPIGDGIPGAVFGQVLETWNMTVGLDIAGQARSQS